MSNQKYSRRGRLYVIPHQPGKQNIMTLKILNFHKITIIICTQIDIYDFQNKSTFQ